VVVRTLVVAVMEIVVRTLIVVVHKKQEEEVDHKLGWVDHALEAAVGCKLVSKTKKNICTTLAHILFNHLPNIS
jgi:hypothetical protein